jgi:hypothetical protein
MSRSHIGPQEEIVVVAYAESLLEDSGAWGGGRVRITDRYLGTKTLSHKARAEKSWKRKELRETSF